MDHAALYEHELPAFALPSSLDRPPPLPLPLPLPLPPPAAHAADLADLADLEGRRLDASLAALGLSAPLMGLDETAMLFADLPRDCARRRPTPRCRAKHTAGLAASPSRTHKPHHVSKKASRKQVHKLQAMVNAMQVQVDGAAAEIQQLAQLVGQFALQRQHHHQQLRERQQSLDEHEMDMDLHTQQRQLHAQVELERRQFEQQQQY
ncbi:hypothetical protein PHYSODRAFT_319838 [Phytophthora sojae]|uniref:Uncharacterized protein n=1 Tax=Phytophthora sojae (strain P6497) TaxID=1094619 RepID=G5AE89_PHYSP|nr:hypothetical protein PHYSODRAFT_319837 [Phytophthora sojae]XP_009538388.1 hypothetical protein PHYSODRAFT_319838 [Phytophthora sojae]EGZ06490.1 hypothetical protein PHYSODRAFT_319837 [Phytophthora sojae]EGZ06491.1 hypothetical protein PHYSODRAFT_319838 [Phytophthora sojae]|eukprot:XP_009538387.1 hypothetical protein PHYSODRAFT_319837 [Phytophthora sojae]